MVSTLTYRSIKKPIYQHGKTRLKFVAFVILIVFISGCNEINLYSNLSEKEANEMQAILLGRGINCDKLEGKEMTWILTVSKDHMAEAIKILNGYGYPKETFADMGEIFKKQGLVSSHMEERIRYIYALSQEVSETISKIDGVITARVHVVLPDNDPLSEYFQPSSASVFVKHRQTVDFTPFMHQIKQLVVNSIEGLNYDKVTVFNFPAPVVTAAAPEYSRVMGIEVEKHYAGRFRMLVYGLGFFLCAFMIFCIFLVWQVYKLGGLRKAALQNVSGDGSLHSLQDHGVSHSRGQGNNAEIIGDSSGVIKTNQTMGMKLKQRGQR